MARELVSTGCVCSSCAGAARRSRPPPTTRSTPHRPPSPSPQVCVLLQRRRLAGGPVLQRRDPGLQIGRLAGLSGRVCLQLLPLSTLPLLMQLQCCLVQCRRAQMCPSPAAQSHFPPWPAPPCVRDTGGAGAHRALAGGRGHQELGAEQRGQLALRGGAPRPSPHGHGLSTSCRWAGGGGRPRPELLLLAVVGSRSAC